MLIKKAVKKNRLMLLSIDTSQAVDKFYPFLILENKIFVKIHSEQWTEKKRCCKTDHTLKLAASSWECVQFLIYVHLKKPLFL